MIYPPPIYVGQFDTLRAGDIVDLYIDIAADLVVGETVSTVAFTVTDFGGTVVPAVVGTHSESDSRTDFRVTAPAAGIYQLAAVFTISDGQKITRIAALLSA